jgi:RNA polymerase sigma factor (sigma-70 family)
MIPRDEEALLRANLGLARKVANQFRHRGSLVGLEWGDLYSVAQLALLKASRRFDPSRGFQFSTYVVNCMVGETIRALDIAEGQRRGIGISRIQRLKGLRRELPPMHYSTDALLLGVGGGGNDDDLRPELPDPVADPEEEALAILEREALWSSVRRVLNEREWSVMRLRFSEEAPTLEEIGGRLGRSKEGVRHIEKRSLEKLREVANTGSGARFGEG